VIKHDAKARLLAFVVKSTKSDDLTRNKLTPSICDTLITAIFPLSIPRASQSPVKQKSTPLPASTPLFAKKPE
jgi:hypothetical protein